MVAMPSRRVRLAPAQGVGEPVDEVLATPLAPEGRGELEAALGGRDRVRPMGGVEMDRVQDQDRLEKRVDVAGGFEVARRGLDIGLDVSQ